MSKKSLLKILILIVAVVFVGTLLLSCTPREENPNDPNNSVNVVDPGTVGDIGDVNTDIKLKGLDEAKTLVQEAVNNRKKTTVVSEDPEWFVINAEVDFKFLYDSVNPGEVTDINLGAFIKLNMNLKDNSKSEMLIELANVKYGQSVAGFYYADKTLYVDIGGNKYYTEAINLRQIGQLLGGALGGIDITPILAGLVTGETGIEAIDGILSLASFLLFNQERMYKTTYENGAKQDISVTLKLDDVLGMLNEPGAFSIAGIDEISWTGFGLPDFDPLMKQLIGFNLADILSKNWPPLNGRLKAMTERETFTTKDEDGHDVKTTGYVYKGLGLSISTENNDPAKGEHFEVDLKISPLSVGLSDEKTFIDFSTYGFGAAGKGTTYQQAGLANLEIQGELFVENKQNGNISLGDILGTVIDLGDLANVPILFTDEKAYVFGLDARIALDLFDYRNNRLEISLNLQKQPFVRIYLDADVLYVDLSAIRDKTGQLLPNLKFSGLNINELLKGVLDTLSPFIDPNYVPAADEGSGSGSGSGSGEVVGGDEGGEEGGGEEGGESGSSIDVLAIIDFILQNMNFDNAEDNSYRIISVDLDASAINRLLGMFVNLPGELGLPGIRIAIDQMDPLHSIEINVQLSDTVDAGLRLTNVGYFYEPDFQNYTICDTPEKQAAFADIMFTQNYNATLAGQASIGGNQTSGGVDLSGIIGLIADNILLNLGVSQTGGIDIKYELRANLDILHLERLEVSLILYLPGANGTMDQDFLMVYYSGSDDTLYLDLQRLEVLKARLPALNIIGKLPALKIEDLGLAAILEGLNFDLGIQSPQNVFSTLLLGSPAYVMTDPYQFIADLYYNPLTLASVAMALAEEDGNAPEDTGSGINMQDIFGLIGGALDQIRIDTRMNSLQVILNAQLLTVLMAFLNLDITMPEVRGGLTVNLSGSRPDGDGYLKLEFSIQDSKVSDIKAIYLEWDVLNNIRVNVGKQNVIVGDFNLSDYTNLQTFIEDLVVGIKVAGNLELTSDEPNYENDYLNGLIASLIKGLGVKFQFGDMFGIRLSYAITANIRLDTQDLIGGILDSELSLVIRDKDAQKNVLGVYLKDRKMYLDLSYFGMPSIGLSDIGFLADLLKGNGNNTPTEEQEVLVNPSNAELSAWQAARASAYRELSHLEDPEKVALQIWLGGDKVSINLAQDVIAALLGALLNGSELPIKFKDTSLELKLSDGIQLELSTGVEVLNLYLDLAEFRVNVMKEDLFEILLPDDVTFLMADQLPDTSVYVKVGGSLFLKAEPEEGENDITVDLSPALNKLLPSVPLNVFLQFLGVVDGQLSYEIEAALNFKDIVKSVAHISLTSHGNNVLTIYYDGGDMYIDSPIAKIGKVYIKDVAGVIQDLINGDKETDPETEALIKNLSEEQHEAYQYINVMFHKGGIGLSITKVALLTVLSSLGVDLSEAFENIELQINAGLYVHPMLGIELNVDFAGAKIGLYLGGAEFYINKGIEMPSLDGYQTVEKLSTLEVFVGGAVDLGVYAKDGGETDFSYIMDLIKGQIGEVSLPEGFDLESMLNFGLLLKVIGERFGGTIYLHVEASLNIENITDLQLGLYISSKSAYDRYSESGNTAELGDVLSFYILGDAKGALDAYLDGTGIGLEKIKLTDLSGFIGQFTNTSDEGIQTPVALPQNAAKQARDADKLAAGIILSIASDSEYMESMNNAPIFLNVTSGAIFALLKSFNVDVERYFGEFVPSASLSFGGESILELQIGLEELLKVKAKLDMPVISVNASADKFKNIKEDRDFYHLNRDEKLNIKLTFNGEIDFQAKDTDEESEVNLTALLQHFLGETQFGVLLQNLGYAGKTITYEVQFSTDLKALIAAATDEGGMSIDKILKTLNVLVTIRVDGNPLTLYLTDGSLYADLTLLNMGKVVIKDLANLKIGGEAEESSVVRTLSRPMNAAYNLGERAEMAYVSLTMGNDVGVYLAVAMDVLRIALNGMGMPGDLIGDTVNDTLELKLGVGHDGDLLNIALKVANYSLKASFNKVNVNFENYNVVLSGFYAQDYTEINENLSEVYVKLNLEFGLEMDADSHFNAREILDDLALISGLSIEPVISILAAISGNFLLEVEGRLNIQSLFDSSLAVTLSAYDGVTKTYVLSVVYVNRDLYLDAECFSIQKVRIINAEEYFKTIIGIIKDLGKDDSTDTEVQNAEGEFEPDVNPIAAYINISLSPEGLVASVGSAAIFAALQLVGLDLGKYVNPLGTIDVRAALLTPEEIISLSLKFLAHKTDGNNRPIKDENGDYIPKGEGVEIYFKINNDFVVELSTAKMPKISAPVGNYVEVSDSIPTLGIHTKIVLEFEAGAVSMTNLNKEPLSSILGNVLTDVLLQIALDVKGDQAARFEFDILVNLNVLDIRSAEIQVVINKVNSDSVFRIAQANVYDGDMYVDLSPMNGPKFAIIEFMETILGQKDFDGELNPDENDPEEKLSLITIPELLAAGKLSNAAAESTKALTVNAQIQKAGLFVFVYKAAFNTLLNFFNLNDLEIFSDLSVNLFVKPINNTIHLGLEADIQPNTTSPKDGIRAYIALEGLGVNFQKYDNETLIIPQSSRYLQAHNIDVIDLSTTFEFGIETEEGRIALTELFKKLLPDEDALISTLPQNILLDALGDTLVVDLAAKINISDMSRILNNLQIRGKISSKKAPDKFTLEIIYYNNDLFIDGSGVGLSKIKLANMSGLLGFFIDLINGGGNGETPVPDAEDAGQLLTRMSYLLNNTNATDMTAQREIAEATVKLSLDHSNGLLVTVCTDMIRAVVLMLGFDINDYIQGVVAPEVSVGMTPDMTYEIKIDVNNDVSDPGGLHLRLALLGQNTFIDLEDEILVATPSGMGTTIVPLISPEEQKEYTNYDKLTVYLESNISLAVDLKDGRLAADGALGMILNVLGLTVDQFMTDISFAGGNERLEVNLQAKVGVNFAKLLSRDWSQVREAISAFVQISYSIIDTHTNTVYHSQPLGTMYLTSDNIYLDIEIMSSHVKVKIPDAKLAETITGLFGMTPEGEDNAGNASENENSRYNKLLNMYKAFYSEDGTTDVETLKSVIRLNSSGLSLLITRELLVNLGAFLIDTLVKDETSGLKDLTAEKLDEVLRDIVDAAELKINVEDGFSLDLRLYKDPEDKISSDETEYTTAGYEIKLSLLNHTRIATDLETYSQFANYLSDDEALVEFYNTCFDSRDIVWRASVGLDFVLTADFMEYVLDWSGLFSNEGESGVGSADTRFFIQVLDRLKGGAILGIRADIHLTEIAKLALDAIITVSDLQGNEVMGLYFMGNLTNKDNYADVGPQLYLTAPGMGINGIQINAAVFEQFIGLDLLPLLASIGQGKEETPEEEQPGEPEPEQPDDGDDEPGIGDLFEDPDNPYWFINILDSIEFAKGTIAIVVAQTALQTVLNALLGFPFDEVGKIRLVLDNVNNSLSLEVSLDFLEEFKLDTVKLSQIENYENATEEKEEILASLYEVEAEFKTIFQADKSYRLFRRYDGNMSRYVYYFVYDDATQDMVDKYVTDFHRAGFISTKNAYGMYTFNNTVSDLTANMTLIEGKLVLIVTDTIHKYNLGLAIQNIDVVLGQNNIFVNQLGDGYVKYFEENFRPLNEYKWEFEINSELTIDDTVGGLFDLSEPLKGIFGKLGDGTGVLGALQQLKLALQPSEDIAITLGFSLRAYIDFSDLTPLRLQLSMTYNGKEIVLISYIGTLSNDYGEPDGTVYIDLSGLSLPSVKLSGLNLGGIVGSLLNSIDNASFQNAGFTESDGTVPENAAMTAVLATALKAERGLDYIDLAGVGWETAMLLLTASKSEFNIAITGALAYSLIHGLGLNVDIPMFRNLQIGYSEKDGLAGIIIRLTDDEPYEQAFRIGYNFRESYSHFDADLKSTINPKDIADKTTTGDIEYVDVGTLNELGLGLDVELRLRTKSADGGKTEQVEALEYLLERIIGMEEGSINLDLQSSMMVFGLSIKVYANLADLEKSTLYFGLSYAEEDFLSIYYFGSENAVYADLSGLGLFQAVINGVDLMSIISVFLGGIITEGEGITVSEMISGLLDGLGASNSSNAEDAAATVAGLNNAENAGYDLQLSSNAPLVRILLGNETLTINPNASVLALFVTGYDIPSFSDIRLSTNLAYGLNNLNFRLKLDPVGNNVTFNVAENMFGIKIGPRATDYQQKLAQLGNVNEYGAVNGIVMNATDDGQINAGFNLAGMLTSLVDTISLDNLSIYLDKRNDYWYMRDLRYGMPTPALLGGDGTGPFYLGYEDMGYGTKNGAIKFTIAGFEVELLDTFNPVMMNNAYRRLRLMLDKTSDNMINVYLSQLTQVLGVTNNFHETDTWEPMQGRAFIDDYLLRISLDSLLVFDISDLAARLIKLVLDQLVNLIPVPGAGLVGGLITSLISPLLGDLVADLIGNLTGYGNPLKLGKIVDSFTGGGIGITNIFLPKLLASDPEGEYGSLYGMVTDENNQGIAGATVVLAEGKYTTQTDKDGRYAFINIPVNTYNLDVTAPADGDYLGLYDQTVEILSYTEYPATEANWPLDKNDNGASLNGMTFTVKGMVKNAAEKGQSGIVVTWDQGNTNSKTATTTASGEFLFSINTVNGYEHTLSAIVDSQYVEATVRLNKNQTTYEVDLQAEESFQGQLVGYLKTVDDSALIEGYVLRDGGKNMKGIVADAEYRSELPARFAGILRYTNPIQVAYSPRHDAYYAVYAGGDLANFDAQILTGFSGYEPLEERTDLTYRAMSKGDNGIQVELRRLPQAGYTVVAMRDKKLIPVTSDVELWLESNGRTIRLSDAWDGSSNDTVEEASALDKQTPRNYLVYNQNGEKKEMEATGRFQIKGLQFGKAYTVKIRSGVYENSNVATYTMYQNNNGGIKDLGTLVLTKREKRWADEESKAGSMIQGIRIRLGADVLDSNGVIEAGYEQPNTDPGYTPDGIPSTAYKWLNDLQDNLANTTINWLPGLAGSFINNAILKKIVETGLGWVVGNFTQDQNAAYKDEKGKPIFMPFTNYVSGYEQGPSDRSDNVTYIEAWLNSDFVANLFGLVNGLLQPMLGGMSAVTKDQRYTMQDLAVAPEGTSKDDTNLYQFNGVFDESRDELIYEPIYETEAEYRAAMVGANAKLNAGAVSMLLNYVFTMLPDFAKNQYLRMAVQVLATRFLDEILDQVTRMVSHILPLTSPYSMIEEKDLAGSPLNNASMNSTLSKAQTTDVKDLVEYEGALKLGKKVMDGNGTTATAPELGDDGSVVSGYGREINFHDMSVYAKVVLNNHVDTMLDRIVLFLNGASYQNWDEIYKGITPDYKFESLLFAPEATVMRADTVYFDEDGNVKSESEKIHKILQRWIATNTVNSYIVISDYKYEKDENGVVTRRLLSETYVRDVYGHFDVEDWEYGVKVDGNPDSVDGEQVIKAVQELKEQYVKKISNSEADWVKKDEKTGESPEDEAYKTSRYTIRLMSAKDDHYLEFDINNTGIRLRVVRELAEGQFNYASLPSGNTLEIVSMMPPEKIVFHDPYNPLDFTAYGGTWADSEGGMRHNVQSDGSYAVNSIEDILPNRNMASFRDGNSTHSAGVQMVWDMSTVKFIPGQDTKGYIVGYCGNQVYGKNKNINAIERIPVEVDGKLLVDPDSTLHIKKDANGNYVIDTENTSKVFDLDPIDPLNFDSEAYLSKLPDQFEYAVMMRYDVDGEPERFNIGGISTDYVLKRYVFNDLEWSFDGTKLVTEGGDTSLQLTYGTRIAVDDEGKTYGSKSEKVTIRVPVKVKPRKAISVWSVEEGIAENSYSEGIQDNKIVFNPLENSDPKSVMESVTKLKVYSGEFDSGRILENGEKEPIETMLEEEWQVISVNASSLRKYDPRAITHPDYTVIYVLGDDFGLTQEVRVTVEILPRTIEWTSLNDTFGGGDALIRKVSPFVDNATDTATRLGLLPEIQVGYTGYLAENGDKDYGRMETLTEGEDYVWVIPEMDYTFVGKTKRYTGKLVIGNGDYVQTIEVTFEVEHLRPTGIGNILVYPYGDSRIQNAQSVVFHDGVTYATADKKPNVYFSFAESVLSNFNYTEVEVDGKTYQTDVSLKNPSFAGNSYYADVLIPDDVFGNVLIENVNVVVLRSVISGLVFKLDGDEKINQYFAEEEIDALLKRRGHMLRIYQGNKGLVSDSYFEIGDWSFADEGGLSYKEENYLNIEVRNKGYNGNPVWSQEILVRLDSVSYLNENGTEEAVDANGKTLKKSLTEDLTVSRILDQGELKLEDGVYTLTIDDPYQMNLPTVLTVVYNDTTVSANTERNLPVTWSMGENMDDFYKVDSLLGTVTIGSGNNAQTFKVKYVNNRPRSQMDLKFYTDENRTTLFNGTGSFDGYTVWAFDDWSLPQYATLTYLSETMNFPVYWASVESYTNTEDADIKATAWVGDNVFGYFKEEVTIHVNAERLLTYAVPPMITLNAYGNIETQIGAYVAKELAVTTTKGARTLSVVYPEIPLSYESEHQYELNFEVGIRTDFGKVGNVRNEEWVENFGFEVRQAIPCTFIVEERYAIGIQQELVGSIYDPVDFDALKRTKVLFRSGQQEIMDVSWNLDELTYTFLGGIFYVEATLGKGIAGLEQTFTVRVDVRPSQLKSLSVPEAGLEAGSVVTADGKGAITELTVDPFVGFVGLPDTITAHFIGVEETANVSVSWQYLKVLNAMTLEGGRYDAENNMAAIATIYMPVTDKEGNETGRTAIQSLEVPVTVLDRTIQGTKASQNEDGTNLKSINNIRNEMNFNPYSGQYSEKFDDENFSYYKYIVLEVKDGNGTKNIEFPLTADNWKIRDTATGRATVLDNLYTGRNVSATLTFGPGNPTAAKDATMTINFSMKIWNMTYKSGLPEELLVDPYGWKTNPNAAEYDARYLTDLYVYENGSMSETPYTLTTVEGGADEYPVTFDLSKAYSVFDAYDRETGKITYAGGIGRMYAEFGNDYGGKQRVLIRVLYENRTVESLFDESAVSNFGKYTLSTGAEQSGFILDPFANYSAETSYVTTGDVTMQGERPASWAQFTKMNVTWHDEKVRISYRGSTDGYVVAMLTRDAGDTLKEDVVDEYGNTTTKEKRDPLAGYTQYIQYHVKVMNRTVTGYTNVLKSNNPNFKVSPYRYLNSYDIANDVANDVFMPVNTKFMVEFAEGDPIEFTLGGEAKYHTSKAADGSTRKLELSEGEESLVMKFQMDVTRGLSYKGKDIRFYLTIPSFGMNSALDRQLATFNVPCNEQYIRKVEFGDTINGSYTDFISWASRHDPEFSSVVTQNRVAMDSGNDYVFDVSNPYYFIKQGGLTMPDYVKIYVGNADGTGTAEVYSGIETFWSGGSGNKTRIYYNRETVESSFQIEMDNQSFKLQFKVTPWILDNTLLFSEQTQYGEDEVILLPGSAKRSEVGKEILTLSKSSVDNDTYRINFGNGRVETFSGIAGGGTYTSHYNKWSFDTVDFSGAADQRARLTLGGKGGQEIEWSMRTTVKYLVNNTVANSYALKVGERITLPTTYQQVFAGSTFGADGSVNNAPVIDVQYGQIRLFSQSGRSGVRQSGAALNQLEGWRATPAVPLTEWEVTDQQVKEDKEDHIAFYEYRDPDFVPTDDVKVQYFTASPSYITWDATDKRAYPSPDRSVGGVIYLTCYRTPDILPEDTTHGVSKNNADEDAYMHHPDAFYGYSDLRPGVNEREVKYNMQEMSPNGQAVSDANAHVYNVPQTGVKLTAKQSGSSHVHEIEGTIPTIELQANSLFDVRYLPTISVRSRMDAIIKESSFFTGQKTYMTGFNWDMLYMIPWSKSTVYFCELSDWRDGAYGIPLTAGISGIDTGRAGIYTLVVEMNMNSTIYKLVVKLHAHSYTVD